MPIGFDFTKEDYEKLIIETTKIIESEKQDQIRIGTAYYKRGWAYNSIQEEKKAIPDFTRAIEIIPDHDDAYFMRAISHYKSYIYDEAFADAKKALQLNGKDPQYKGFIKKLKSRNLISKSCPKLVPKRRDFKYE